jgi:hypothetical protein
MKKKWYLTAETCELKLLEHAQRSETLGKGHEAFVIHFTVCNKMRTIRSETNTYNEDRALEAAACSSRPVREAHIQQRNQYLIMITMDEQ